MACRLRLGDPVAFLPLLSFTLLKFSRHVARFILRNGYEVSTAAVSRTGHKCCGPAVNVTDPLLPGPVQLAGKTDQRFVESVFRMLRELLSVRTVLTPAQFFEQGFAERKVLLLCDLIAAAKRIHNEEVRQERLAALKANRQVGARPSAARCPLWAPVRSRRV